MVRRYETEADDFFRDDARRLGYMADQAHEPGDGRGLWAYYRDHDMLPPKFEGQDLKEKELTILDIDDDNLLVADIHGSPTKLHGRHTSREDWSD